MQLANWKKISAIYCVEAGDVLEPSLIGSREGVGIMPVSQFGWYMLFAGILRDEKPRGGGFSGTRIGNSHGAPCKPALWSI